MALVDSHKVEVHLSMFASNHFDLRIRGRMFLRMSVDRGDVTFRKEVKSWLEGKVIARLPTSVKV